MTKRRHLLLSAAIFSSIAAGSLSSSSALAVGLTLPQIDQTVTDPLFRTFASTLMFRPIEPAGDLGRIWGFYVGLSGSGTDTSVIQTILANGGNSQLSLIPMVDLQAGLGLPLGIQIQVGFLPSIPLGSWSYAKYGGALQWTFSDIIGILPLDLAGRFTYTNGSLNGTEPFQGATVTVTYNTNIEHFQLLASKKLAVLTPYLGVGLANQSSSLTGTGSATFFGGTLTGQSSTTGASLQPTFTAGLMLKLLILGFTGEYDYSFGMSTYSGKVSIRI